VVLLLSQGQMSDYKGAGLMIDVLPPARGLIADRGYDSDGFRAALEDLDIAPCIPSRKNRKHPHPHDPDLYRQRYPIENMFARFKDYRRIATRSDRCADIFMRAITLTAIVIFWLRK
jgi:transposase